MKVSTAFCQIMVLFLVAMAATSQTPTPRSTPIGVGDMAPDFTLEDQNRNQVTLSAARSQSPVVLVFYRGYW